MARMHAEVQICYRAINPTETEWSILHPDVPTISLPDRIA